MKNAQDAALPWSRRDNRQEDLRLVAFAPKRNLSLGRWVESWDSRRKAVIFVSGKLEQQERS